MISRRFALPTLVALIVGGCGSGDDGTGFIVRAKVRGMAIQSISQVQYRFESTGSARFESDSNSEAGVSYTTEDGGRVFTATGGQSWVTNEYAQSGSEFVFEMPFVNPEGGGDTDLQVLIHREIEGDMVLAGESAIVAVRLPAAPGAEFEPVVGCVVGGQCRPEIEPEQ